MDVIFRYVRLRKSGLSWRGHCPVHGGKSGRSLSVSEEKQLFYCFRCEVGGDVIAFLRWVKDLSFTQAIEQLEIYERQKGGT